MLEFVNLFLILVIIAVLTTIIIMFFDFRGQVKTRLDKLSAFQKAEENKPSISLVDIAEFEKLNPDVKKIYKKYIVDDIMPRVVNKVNTEALTPNTIQELDKAGKIIQSMSDEQLFADPFVAQPSQFTSPIAAPAAPILPVYLQTTPATASIPFTPSASPSPSPSPSPIKYYI